MVRRPGFVAVAKVQVPVKAKLWVREYVFKSEGKHEKNQAQNTPKRRGH